MSKMFSVVWGEFSSNITETFKDIRKYEKLNDVTLVCDDGEVSAHKLILYGGSDFFRSVLSKVKHRHPIIFMKDVKLKHLEAIVEFMYNGEVNVPQDDLNLLLEVAKDLKIKGLSEKSSESMNTKLNESSKENGTKDPYFEQSNQIEEKVDKFSIEKEGIDEKHQLLDNVKDETIDDKDFKIVAMRRTGLSKDSKHQKRKH